MFKNLKLGAKLNGAFLIVAVLTVLLGSLAVYSMLKVKTVSNVLAQENVPAVAVANEVERDSLQTMYSVRGYAFTEDKQFLEQGRNDLVQVKQSITAASAHAEKYGLKVLGANSKLAAEKVAAYEGLVNDTVKATEQMDKDKAEMDASAATYMKVCHDFLDGQGKKLDEEIDATIGEKLSVAQLKERIKKTVLCNEVIDLGNSVRIGAWKSMSKRDPEIFNAALALFPAINAKLDELKAITRIEANLRQIDACRAAGESYHKAMESFLTNWIARENFNKKRNTVADEVLKAAQDTAKFNMNATSTAAENAATSLASASNLLIAGSLVCVVLGLALGFFITRSITRPILAVADALSSGAEQTASAASQVSSASQTLAAGASQQAASLEETSASLEEMSSMTKRNADNAQRANDLAREANQTAAAGAADMQSMSTAMSDIKTSSDDIAKIIKTIDEIAFQTNILALNAAVEAARAGEAGMGFAVVAEEVRNLAQRSAVAAKETAAKIEGAINKTALGVQLSDKVARTLNEIVTKAGQVDQLVAEVATASKEQMQGITQVNTAITEIDKVTQSNAANAEESASAAEEMSAQTEALKEAVAELLAMVNGAGALASAPTKSTHAHAAAAAAAHKAPVLKRPVAGSNGRGTKPAPAAPDFFAQGSRRNGATVAAAESFADVAN